MNSNIGQTNKMLIKITESVPQKLEPKKHFFLGFKNQTNDLPISPRRDEMEYPNTDSQLKVNGNLKVNNTNIPIPIPIPESSKMSPEEERIDKKITEHIKNRKDIDGLFEDPEIKLYLKDEN